MSFYILNNPLDNPALTDFEEAEPVHRGDAPHCPKCGKTIGLLEWLPPYRAKLVFWGKEAGDMAFAGGSQFLVSEHFVRFYEEFGLSGLTGFDPVEIVKVVRKKRTAPKETPRYYCAAVTRSQAVVDHKASGLMLQRPWTCDYCRLGGIKRMTRLVMIPNTWPGEDIFIARGLPGRIIASERFKNFCEKAGIKNGELIAAEEFHFDHYPNERSE